MKPQAPPNWLYDSFDSEALEKRAKDVSDTSKWSQLFGGVHGLYIEPGEGLRTMNKETDESLDKLRASLKALRVQ